MILRRRLSRLEAALYAAIAAVLAAVLLDRALTYFALAERAALETTLVSTESALRIRYAYERLQGRSADAYLRAGANPFALAAVKIENFLGEFDRLEPAVEKPGHWAFERASGELVYWPRYRRGLEVAGRGAVLRFRLADAGAGGAPRLVPVAPYRWEP